jgi:hypothetical protein
MNHAPTIFPKGTLPPPHRACLRPSGRCAWLVMRQLELEAAGTRRSLWVVGQGHGVPLVFVWHPLGETARGIIASQRLEGFAERHGCVLVVPDGDATPFRWGYVGDPTGDVFLFDEMRRRLVADGTVDVDRVGSVGMSAGGLWTTWLAMHRSEDLAAVAVLSGGTDPSVPWIAPRSPIPVLVAWGGPRDTWGPFSFDRASRRFVRQLRDNGHLVVEVEHGGGHSLPPRVMDLCGTWLLAHRRGQPSPFAHDVSALPGARLAA